MPRAVVLLAVWLGNAGILTAQITPPTPAVKPVSIEVAKGGSVVIELKVESAAPTLNVEYIVREFPQSGTLGFITPSPDDRTKATLTYQAAPDAPGDVDYFTYSARHPGGLHSPPARVEIKLITPTPRLSCPPLLDFGRIAVGAREERQITLLNSGTGPFEASLALPPPFEWVSPPDGRVKIAPGEGLPIRLAVSVQESGAFQGEWVPQPGQAACRLFGTGFEPVAVNPDALTLALNPTTGEREATFSLTNALPSPAPLRLMLGDRLRVSPEDAAASPALPVSAEAGRLEVTLPPTQTLAFRASLPKEDGAALDSTLGIQAGARTYSIRLKAGALPAKVVFDPPPAGDRFSLGTVQASPETPFHSAPLRLKNAGGSPISLRVDLEPPFILAGLPRKLTLEGGASQEFHLALEQPLPPGPIARALIVRADPGGTILQRLPLDGVVPAPQGDELNDPLYLSRRESMKKLNELLALNPLLSLEGERDQKTDLPKGYDRSPLGFITRDYKPREYVGSLPRVLDILVDEVTTETIRLRWKRPTEAQEKYVIDIRYDLHDVTTNAITSVWMQWPDLPVNLDGETAWAVIPGLEPGKIYEFRVVSTDGDELFASPSPSFAIQTATKARKSFGPGDQVLWGSIALAVVLLFWWRMRRKRRQGPSSTTLWAKPSGGDSRL